MRYVYETLINESPSGNITSPAMSVKSLYTVAFQVVSTGTLSGTVKLQASLDGTNFFDLTGATVTLSGSSVTSGYPLTFSDYFPFSDLKIVYTHSSGSGTLVVTAGGKGV